MIREFINIVEGLRVTDDWFKDGGFKTYKRPAKERYEIADTLDRLTPAGARSYTTIQAKMLLFVMVKTTTV